MFYLAYNILSIFLLIPVLAFSICRSLSHKWPLAIARRFGHITAEDLKRVKGRPVIWVHAVSVGEVIAARPLICGLRDRYPSHALVISNSTDTGKQMASGLPGVDLCIYFPFDFLPSVRHSFNLLNPALIVIMETEIWPNFNHEAARRRIPLILANGRISDRSFPRYTKFSWFFRRPLQDFTLLCMQSAVAHDRILAIGAVPGRAIVTGNLKYDVSYHPVNDAEKVQLRRRYGIPDDSVVITAGSTHGNEEEMVVDAFRKLVEKGERRLFLVLAPRHPQRCTEIAGFLERTGVRFRRFTEMNGPDGDLTTGVDLLLVDTVGELMHLYALADLAFVGGSLVPVGGHNLLEPASREIPVIFGPFMSNFAEIAELVLKNRAGIQVPEAEALPEALRGLVDDPASRETLGENGLEILRQNGGATRKHLDAITGQLPP